MLNIPKVALYARFSSDNQRSESIDAQVRAMKQFCSNQKWQVVATYIDEARSATTDNRPQFQQMIADSSKGEFEIVLVHKLDRFSRDRYDSAIYKKKLKKNNVKLCSVLERIDDSPESIMMESVLEGMAEYYSKNLARETMKGMYETAVQTKHCGGCAPLGYDVGEDGKLKINTHEAEAVKIIFEMYSDGYGYSDIISRLNEKGYHPKRGGLFKKNSLQSILNNEKYTGVYVFNKERKHGGNKTGYDVVRVDGGCPQIITKSLFDKVQRTKTRKVRNQGRYHSKEFYLLTGKLVCGICGKSLIGNVRYSGRNKTRLATYRCQTHRIECRNKELNKDYLDAYVVVMLGQKLLNISSMKKYVNKVNRYITDYNKDYSDNHSEVMSQYNTVNENLNNITSAIEQGVINESIIKRAEELETRKKELESRLQGMAILDEISYNDFSDLIRKYKTLGRNTYEFRTFVSQFIKEIVVRPYDFDVVLNVGLGITDELTETITMRRGDLYELFDSRVKEAG